MENVNLEERISALKGVVNFMNEQVKTFSFHHFERDIIRQHLSNIHQLKKLEAEHAEQAVENLKDLYKQANVQIAKCERQIEKIKMRIQSLTKARKMYTDMDAYREYMVLTKELDDLQTQTDGLRSIVPGSL